MIELPGLHGENLRLGVINLPSFYAQFDVGGPRHQEIANTRAALERQTGSHLVDETTSVNPVWQAYEEELARARATGATPCCKCASCAGSARINRRWISRWPAERSSASQA